ncbi:hypothetical protein EIN_059330 [Entamoeba invadens IP1]|uniref:hypothetical protein n=1 Tax=Entamoeba invadens IP1 TaxID=370355 RepID=UPI0002C3E874|nr:hypothetical protein EIN_059330 [Entamoeba invadens IP1]ELP93448.1 hypothetical protein EIN_059330 [Entamoeba invadens IP1]|eukprot:XP_004260219.1 hypothetical protein EIN_059330 [Entamoeba invadens IP1]
MERERKLITMVVTKTFNHMYIANEKSDEVFEELTKILVMVSHPQTLEYCSRFVIYQRSVPLLNFLIEILEEKYPLEVYLDFIYCGFITIKMPFDEFIKFAVKIERKLQDVKSKELDIEHSLVFDIFMAHKTLLKVTNSISKNENLQVVEEMHQAVASLRNLSSSAQLPSPNSLNYIYQFEGYEKSLSTFGFLCFKERLALLNDEKFYLEILHFIEALVEAISTLFQISPQVLRTENNEKPRFGPKEQTNIDVKSVGKTVVQLSAVLMFHNLYHTKITQVLRTNAKVLRVQPEEMINVIYKIAYSLYRSENYYGAINTLNVFFTVKKSIFPTFTHKLIEDSEKMVLMSSRNVGSESPQMIISQFFNIESPTFQDKVFVFESIRDSFKTQKNSKTVLELVNVIVSTLEDLKENQTKRVHLFISEMMIYLLLGQLRITTIEENERLGITTFCELEQQSFKKDNQGFQDIRLQVFKAILSQDYNGIGKLIDEIKTRERSNEFLKTSPIDVNTLIAVAFYFRFIIFTQKDGTNEAQILDLMKGLSYIEVIDNGYKGTKEYKQRGNMVVYVLTKYVGMFCLYGDLTSWIKSVDMLRRLILEAPLSDEECIECEFESLRCYIEMGYTDFTKRVITEIERKIQTLPNGEEKELTTIEFLLFKASFLLKTVSRNDTDFESLIDTIAEAISLYETQKRSSSTFEITLLKGRFLDIQSGYNERIGEFNLSFDQRKSGIETRSKLIEKIEKNEPIKMKRLFSSNVLTFLTDMINSYIHFGWLTEVLNNYLDSLKCYNFCFKLCQLFCSYGRQIEIQGEIGELEMKCGNYEKSIEAFTFVDQISSSIKRYVSVKRQLIMIFMRLGDLYNKTGELSKALEYYQLSKKLVEEVIQSDKIEPLKIEVGDSTNREFNVRQSLDGKMPKNYENMESSIFYDKPKKLKRLSEVKRKTEIKREIVHRKTSKTKEVYYAIKGRIDYKILKLTQQAERGEKVIEMFYKLLETDEISGITRVCILNEIGRREIDNDRKDIAIEVLDEALTSGSEYGIPILLHKIYHNMICCVEDEPLRGYANLKSIGLSYRLRFPVENEGQDLHDILKSVSSRMCLVCISSENEKNEIAISHLSLNYCVTVIKKTSRGLINDTTKRINEIEGEIRDAFGGVSAHMKECEKKSHWNKVHSIDQEIESVTETMSKEVLGYLRVLLFPVDFKETEDVDVFLRSIIHESMNCDIKNKSLFYSIIRHIDILSDEEVFDGVEDVTGKLVGPIEGELLLHRLRQIKLQEVEDKPVHVVLILDKQFHRLPWEAMKDVQDVMYSRLPSFEPFNTINKSDDNMFYIDKKKGFYVLNPTQDLVRTVERVGPVLNSMGWKGITNSIPDADVFLKALEENDILMYCGHGSGEQFVPGRRIRKLKRCSVSMMMGCKSVRMEQRGEFDPSGVPIDYLVAGSPMCCGNLWSVPDNDLDTMTLEILEWLKSDQEGYLIDVINKAKRKCKSKYFMGASIVCYGFPILKKSN